MGQSRSNFVLIGAIVVLAALALIPEWKEGSSPPSSEGQKIASVEVIATGKEASDNNGIFDGLDVAMAAMDQHIADLSITPPKPSSHAIANPSEPQLLLPLAPGAEWVYRVTGPKTLVPDDTWTMRIVSEPEGREPGMVEMGFGARLSFAPVFSESGSLCFEGLPYMAPIELGAEPPSAIQGELLPHIARVVDGAVWTKGSIRKIVYKYVDGKGQRREEQAVASESDRAQSGPFESVIVPAGRFGAHRIEWLSRVDIRAKGRRVLTDFTTSPYRKETMWVAPGIGIIRRAIVYLLAGKAENEILFELTQYQPADDCVFQDIAAPSK